MTAEVPAGCTAERAWHALPPEQCLALVASDVHGLGEAEAAARLKRYGPNVLPHASRPGLALLFIRQFRSPLIYLLLIAAAVSLLVGEMTDAGFIVVVLLINAAIGTVQENRAASSVEALQSMIRHEARVVRDGRVRTVAARALVCGDIAEFESGMAVAADARLVAEHGLRADESTLTGESAPVAKSTHAEIEPAAGLGDRATMLHAGTTIVEGRARAVVVATGQDTALGRIGASLSSSLALPLPLMLRLETLARQIAIATVAVILLLAILLALKGVPAGAILLLAVALAVSAVPEGLPIAVTVALAAATRRMAKRHVIVRSLPAVEGLGACNLIASDKTGTLTMNRLSLERVLLPSGEVWNAARWRQGETSEPLHALGFAGAVCNEATRGAEGSIHGDPVDAALLHFADEVGTDAERVESFDRLALLPYEPGRRYSAVIIDGGKGPELFVKGAPETVLPMCADAGDEVAVQAEHLAADGYRVLAIAGRSLAPEEPRDCTRPAALRLLGFVGLLDPLRPEVLEAIARCTQAGISVRMVTGDHPSTALTIARQLGIAERRDEVMTGADLRAMADDADFGRRIEQVRVFARTEPSQKLDLVEAFASRGFIVAVTGDGVNDAPALQAAHIGVAMGRGGTDVARGASDLVLADDNFASIVAGVEEGRITYGNIRKIIIFLLATGLSEVMMFLAAVATGLPMPLTPVQLIWANLVTEGVQTVMLGFGRGEGDELQRPPRRAGEPLLDRRAVALMLVPAAMMMVLSLALMHWLLARDMAHSGIQNVILLLVVLFQNFFILSIRSERRPIFRESIASNPWLLFGVALALLLHLTAMYWSPLAKVVGTGPVGADVLLRCVGAVVLVLFASEVTKAVAASWSPNRAAVAR